MASTTQKFTNIIDYKLNFSSGTGQKVIKELSSGLDTLQTKINQMGRNGLLGSDAVQTTMRQADELANSISSSINTGIGRVDTSTLTQKLNNIGVTNLQKSFEAAGTSGTNAFYKVITAVGTLQTQVTGVKKSVDTIFNSFAGHVTTLNLVTSAYNAITNSIREAVDYLHELDTSLTNIRIVSDYTVEDMKEFALYANEAAQALGQTTTAYTNASLIYAQQGYDLEDANQLAELTLKVANTTGQTTAEVSEQITAFVNGFGLSLDEVEGVLDKITQVAAHTASDTEELMTAASRVASVASTLGVTTDQLISQMSTIISVTRETPEVTGNARNVSA
jgi:archaellum component FlaC